MRRLASQEEIIADVHRVLGMTRSAEWPKGDTRSSTYFDDNFGTYSKYTVYRVFKGWEEVLRRVFPRENIKIRQASNTYTPFPKTKYKYKKRTCLQCDNQFMSWGPGNWKCKTCLQSVIHLSGGEDTTHELCLPKFEKGTA